MNIYQTITAIIKEIPAISKDKKNEQQGYKFRGIDDVMNALQPLFAKHKLFIVPEILEQTREERITKKEYQGKIKEGLLIYSICKVKYTFYAEDGSNVQAVVIGEGMDTGDKATNKAMAIAMKYVLFQVFCIPTEEMEDPDKTTPEEIKPKEIKKAKEVKDILATEVQITKIKEIYSEEELKELLAFIKKTKIEELTIQEASSLIKRKGENKDE